MCHNPTIIRNVGFKSIVVKNSEKGGNRPIEDYRKDLDAALLQLEMETGIQVDHYVRSTLGASGFAPNSKRSKTYTHPFPFLVSYGNYVFGCVSVPADLDDGRSDFTNLYILATESYLLTVFNDPHWVYNPYFGGAVLSLLERNRREELLSVGETIIRILRFTVLALDHSLEALENRFRFFNRKIQDLELQRSRIEEEMGHYLPAIQDLAIEVDAMAAVTSQTVSILGAVRESNIASNGLSLLDRLFSESDFRDVQGLGLQSANLTNYQSHLAFEVNSLILRCGRLQDKALTIATHHITVVGALILVPNLIYGFFGQAFMPLPLWMRQYGFIGTFGLTLMYWIIQLIWFKKKGYL
jgi:Mg2+ and Co2+ transporter CorA